MKKKTIDFDDDSDDLLSDSDFLNECLRKYDEKHNLTQTALDLQGYYVSCEGDWVVKKYKDGKIEKIKKYK